MSKSSNLDRATYRLRHSLLRREAGEHDQPTELLLLAFTSEWGLNPIDEATLRRRARAAERAIAARRKA